MRAMFLLFVIALTLGGLGGRAQLQQPGGIIQPDVVEALEGSSEVDVIIHLVPPSLPPPDQLTPDTLEAYRQQVAAVQDRVLAKLTAADFTLTYRYSVSAALAGGIAASGVDKLRGHPDVVMVHLDRLLLAYPGPLGPGPIGRGDANCDGPTTSADATLVLQVEAGLTSSVPCPRQADVSGDGEIDSRDAALILQIDAGLCCIWPAAAGSPTEDK